jgi:hypothetical protein
MAKNKKAVLKVSSIAKGRRQHFDKLSDRAEGLLISK